VLPFWLALALLSRRFWAHLFQAQDILLFI